ncbi:MAG: hypothetical protein OXI87_04995, partial [Albidovulum sp.]|nr:hypothetical protein [Albidovulum sp.]
MDRLAAVTHRASTRVRNGSLDAAAFASVQAYHAIASTDPKGSIHFRYSTAGVDTRFLEFDLECGWPPQIWCFRV